MCALGPPVAVVAAGRAEPAAGASRLVVVSNRLPGRGAAGGLVTAVRTALEGMGHGVWLGWSGRSSAAASGPRPGRCGPIRLLAIDLPEAEVTRHYGGFCNRALWPIFHGLADRADLDAEDYRAYRRVNARFARALAPRLAPPDRVWVHDYHLVPLGLELRSLGFRGRIGFFLHIPFPPVDALEVLPWGRELLEGLGAYDLVGFQTARDRASYEEAARAGAVPWPRRTGVYPVGIDPGRWTASSLRRAGRRDGRARGLIVGVDRLDYTKGIPQRLRALARLLEISPDLRGRVRLLQVCAPSRTSIPEYARERRTIEALAASVNDRFPAPGGPPVRCLFRSLGERRLAALYRGADVGLVTPLRDGMNLVAKEFVAAQGADPGVLVLSRLAGAAADLAEALLVDPLDPDDIARALRLALEMPREERLRRHAALAARVSAATAFRWADAFARDLGCPGGPGRMPDPAPGGPESRKEKDPAPSVRGGGVLREVLGR